MQVRIADESTAIDQQMSDPPGTSETPEAKASEDDNAAAPKADDKADDDAAPAAIR